MKFQRAIFGTFDSSALLFKHGVVKKNSKTVIVLILFANNTFVIMIEAILF